MNSLNSLEMNLLSNSSYNKLSSEPSSSDINHDYDDNNDNNDDNNDNNIRWEGYIFLTLSAMCSLLGNSLEPITTFSWLMIPCLLIGLNLTVLNTRSTVSTLQETSKAIGFIIVSQGMAFAFGFLTMFTFEEVTIGGVLLTFMVGCILWILISLIAILAQVKFVQKYESATWAMFIFPITYTAVYHTLVGRIFSTFPSIGNAVLDYAPVRQIASVAGVAGITFTVALVGSALATSYLLVTQPTVSYRASHPDARHRQRSLKWLYGGFVALTAAMGYSLQADNFYQVNVLTQIVPQLNVSCIFGFGFDSVEYAEKWNRMWSHTQERLDFGDNIVMWSEEGLLVTSDKQEREVIQQAQDMVLAHGHRKSFLGVTYQKRLPRQVNSTNMFVLVTPNGEIGWNYQKSHPVPFVEFGVERGPPVLPYHDTDLLIPGRTVRLGGAICFDMDYPTFLHQASERSVDILLQPSWDWQALSVRHFEGDALRSVENGFNYFRCSSDGESGVATARGTITGRQYTGHDPDATVTFALPFHERVVTWYSRVGFVFEWFIAGFTVVIWAHIFLF